MKFTQYQVQIIERLREAAKGHGEVADLLQVLAETLVIDALGDMEIGIQADEEQAEYLRSAVAAASFCEFDRKGR